MIAHRTLVTWAVIGAAFGAMPAPVRAYEIGSVADTNSAYSDFGDAPTINDAGTVEAGDVAFLYSLAGGVSGIAVAFVPEPGSIVGTGAALATLSFIAAQRRCG